MGDIYTRNPHCSNCGSTRGGPMGHETSECTYDSSTVELPPVRNTDNRKGHGVVAERQEF